MKDWPPVEILIPTYNRCESLERTIDSVLNQDYPNLSILISSNGSADGTDAYLRSTALRHINQPLNIGAAANFNFLWGASRAPLRLFLADDDWIDPSYVSQCFEYMSRNACCQVAGQALHYVNGTAIGSDSCYQLLDDRPLIRLHGFCNTITTANGIFYGLRTSRNYFFALEQGSDFCDTYYSILTGKLAVIPTTHIHRDFSNWHGAKAAQASAAAHQMLRVEGALISMHSVLAFFSVASAIRFYLYCDWNISCAFAFLACPENICKDTSKLLRHLHANQHPFRLLTEDPKPYNDLDAGFSTGLLKALHGLLCLSPAVPGCFLISKERLEAFSGMNTVQLFDFSGLWNNFLRNKSDEGLVEMRNWHIGQMKEMA